MSSIISENLKKYRKLNKLTQQEMAQALFVTPQAVSKWERGESLPDISLIPSIASTLHVSISDLWEEEQELNELEQLYDLPGMLKNHQVEAIILKALKKANSVIDFAPGFEFFLLLNEAQKKKVTFEILKMSDSDEIIEEFLYYLPNSIKEEVILQLIFEKRFQALENLVPMMSKSIRTKALEACLKTYELDFLDELFPFLTHSQKELTIKIIKEEKLPLALFENYLTFFTDSQRQHLLEGESQDEH
ncbi:helix-turn-helix transcriptional regulator [Vagococcus fluvialis]|uniref:helix-turn-helix transcriptional regulator n=1 Tax=Vagococcus fluvialis TaxID=2738 RepID=UPI001D0BCE69|nr:helix-turn-helix transcriptional regulator [Vagococcus fluvialis]UDM73653.1 helix-turn-helix transcriptional regulator [Vagococcus fluvialis]